VSAERWRGGTTTLTSGELPQRVAGGLVINGTALADTIFGTESADNINGLNGADMIDAGAGDDRTDGGSGSDTLLGGARNDTYLLPFNGGRDTLINGMTGGSRAALLRRATLSLKIRIQ
jgi:Ca2+-binding RTX toxin-like protein